MAAAATTRRLLELGIVQLLAHAVAADDSERHVAGLFNERLDEDVDLAAARKPDAERHLVGDPVGDETGNAGLHHLLRGKDDVALDASVGDGALEAPVRAHDQLRPDRPGRGAPGGDHRCDDVGHRPKYALRRSSFSRSEAAGPSSTSRPVERT